MEEKHNDLLNLYLKSGLSKVHGWLDPRSAEIIAILGKYQNEADIIGSVGEIGVHHGKLFILLDLLRKRSEKAFAVDVFDHQELNVDKSGFGDEFQFAANLGRFSRGIANIKVFKESSMNIKPEDIIASCGSCRLLSIDGGHTAECTLNDLLIAEQALTPNGIVIVDDFFNPIWPDVSTGVATYMNKPNSKLRPFAISPNKIFLAQVSCHAIYKDALRAKAKRYLIKASRMFGQEVDIFGYESFKWRLINHIKRSKIGPVLQNLYRRSKSRSRKELSQIGHL